MLYKRFNIECVSILQYQYSAFSIYRGQFSKDILQLARGGEVWSIVRVCKSDRRCSILCRVHEFKDLYMRHSAASMSYDFDKKQIWESLNSMSKESYIF